MKIIYNKEKLEKLINKEKYLGFVPTMGAIHRGHIALVNRSLKECKKTLVSIFINKPQFNKKSDFLKYPRTIKKDIFLLKKTKIDILYIPNNKDIYPNGINKKIKINSFSKKLCGKQRKGHFESVVDVVNNFAKIIKPKKIFFGEKDMQQLKIIEDFFKSNHSRIKIVGCRTVREKNGIAFSSRNLLLKEKEKVIASYVYKFLLKNKKKIINKKIPLNLVKRIIFKFGVKKIEYIKVLDVNKINKPFLKKNKYRIFISYYLGLVRLIDNI
tara:strand:- start:3962 stop:4771 length:810 start_codon:yes stop_codon:yes gene_type:complete